MTQPADTPSPEETVQGHGDGSAPAAAASSAAAAASSAASSSAATPDGEPALFEWPAASHGKVRRQLDIEQLIAVERTAKSVVEPVARLWRDLTHAADLVVTPHSIDAVLRDALSTIGRVLSVNTVAVLLANDAGTELVARAAIGLSEELTIGLGIRAGDGMAGTVLQSRRPLVVGDLSKIHVVNPVLRDSGLRSVAAVPLLSGGHPLGVFYAASYEVDRFTDADADLLQTVADRLAAALDRVRLFERERDARREAQELAQRAARMQQISTQLAGTRTAAEGATVLVGALVGAPKNEASSWRAVWLREEDRLELAGCSGEIPDGWHDVDPLDSQTPVADAIRRRLPVFDEGPPASAVLPVMSGDECFAALAVVFAGSATFDAAWREELVSIAAQAAQVFDRARLSAAQARATAHASFFARAAQLLAEADDLSGTLVRLADLAVGALGEICLIDVVGEDGQIVRMAAKHRDPSAQPLVDRLRMEFSPDPAGKHPAVTAIATGRPTWSGHMPDAFLRTTTVDDEHLALVKALGFRSYLTVPLVAEDRVVGSVTSVSTSRPFTRDDVAFAEQLAQHVAAVVDNARRYESAFRTSQILQSSLLPPWLPAVPGVSFDTRYLTANRGLEVGGDFYDVLALPSGEVLLSVGDVAGHDRAAAAQMGHLRSAARALAGKASTPAELIASLRESWELLGFERIATVVSGVLQPGDGKITFASAGHYPPLLVTDRGAEYVPLEPSPPLGIDGPPPVEWRGTLRPGDVVLCFTDGAIDERSLGSDASMQRLREVAGSGARTPRAVCDRVVAMLAPERSDDVALLALSLGSG